MMPFNLGPLEMVFVLVVLLLVFGAKRLPELGSGLGKGIREFKRSISDIKEEVNRPEKPNQIHEPASRPQVSSTASQASQVASAEKTAEPAAHRDQ